MKDLFEKEFIAFQPQLKSYLFRLTTCKQDSEDLTHETYIKALDKIDTFKGKSNLKTWVFAIATNLAKDHFRVKERWGEDWTDLVRDAQFLAASRRRKRNWFVPSRANVW